MKVVRNGRYIQIRSKIGRYASLGGLAVLAGGLLASFLGQQRPELITLSFVCLLIGFILSQVGIYYGNRFVRPDRPDEALTKALKGLDDRFILYHYQLPTPHVLLAPDACYVLAVQPQSGKISAHGDRWKHPLGWKWLFAWASQESIGNPTKAAQLEVETLQAQLAKKLPNVEVPLTPVVVFSNPDVELDISDTAVPVVHIKKLKDWLRGAGKGQGLQASARAEMLKLFGNGE